MFEIPEIIVVRSWDDSVELDLEICEKQITVDAACAAAVLRGSHVFAPGVMSMPHGQFSQVSFFLTKNSESWNYP